jgi:hypothetical protein
MASKKKQYLFKLSGVQPEEVERQYNFKTNSDLSLMETFIPCQSTKITELQNFKHNITIVDELKNVHNAKISTVYNHSNRELCCFWDRHPFVGEPIYCPVEKVQQPLIKQYVSSINGKTYKIQDSMQQPKLQEYYVDGVFCSIECCLAFIEANKFDPIYQNSEYYLREIFNNLADQKRAPSWRLLSVYGGNMTIEEYRKSFINTIYIPDGIVYNPICFLFKENYHL